MYFFVISASKRIKFQSIPSTHGLKTMFAFLQILTVLAYFGTPFVVALGMLLDLEPLTYILGPPSFLPPLLRWLVIYLLTLFEAYEMGRMFLFASSILIYLFQIVASGMNLAKSFTITKGNAFYILKYVKWYKMTQIEVATMQPLLVRGVLFLLVGIMLGIIIIVYVIIRLRKVLSNGIVFLFVVGLLIICSVSKVIWDFAAEVYGQAESLLKKLASAEAICSFSSEWDRNAMVRADALEMLPLVGLHQYKMARMKKVYSRMVMELSAIITNSRTQLACAVLSPGITLIRMSIFAAVKFQNDTSSAVITCLDFLINLPQPLLLLGCNSAIIVKVRD